MTGGLCTVIAGKTPSPQSSRQTGVGFSAHKFKLTHYRNFAIRESQAQEGEFVLVSPEVATCPELARRNMTIPGNRRSLTLPIHLDRLQNFQS